MRLLQAPHEVLELAFSPDGRALAAAIAYHGVFYWKLDAALLWPVQIPNVSSYRRGGLNFSADSRSLSWLIADGRQTFNRDTRQTIRESFAVTKVTYGLTISADGSRVVSQHGLPDNCLVGWSASEAGWMRNWRLSTLELSAESLTLTPDGQRLALFTRSAADVLWWQLPRRLELRDAATAELLGVGAYPYNYACPLLFSPNSQQLVGFNHMTLLVWLITADGALGAPRLVRNDSRKHFTGCVYHPSGRYLYTTSNDTTVHVFDTHTWNRVHRLTWQLGQLRTVTVSSDGNLAAAGSRTGQIVIWDID